MCSHENLYINICNSFIHKLPNLNSPDALQWVNRSSVLYPRWGSFLTVKVTSMCATSQFQSATHYVIPCTVDPWNPQGSGSKEMPWWIILACWGCTEFMLYCGCWIHFLQRCTFPPRPAANFNTSHVSTLSLQLSTLIFTLILGDHLHFGTQIFTKCKAGKLWAYHVTMSTQLTTCGTDWVSLHPLSSRMCTWELKLVFEIS